MHFLGHCGGILNDTGGFMSRQKFQIIALLLLLPVAAWAAKGDRPTRDLAEIQRSGELRVLINQSRHSSGAVKGKIIGVEAVRLQSFLNDLNARLDGKKIQLRLIPTPKNRLLSALARGEGDMVAPGELLETGGHKLLSSQPVVPQVPMILVTRQSETGYQSLEKLAGKTLMLPQGSVAGAAVAQLNRQLARKRQPPVRVEWVDSSLAVEDVLEMVQAGIYPATVVEKNIAERWANVMPKLRLEPKVQLGEPNDIRWFFNTGSPQLQTQANQFLKSYKSTTTLAVNKAFSRAYRSSYRVQHPLEDAARQRLEKVRPTLQRYADKHQLDWLGLAALAFKESTLNPSARGSSGAVGLMQITPGAAQRVGVSGIHRLENNVQASARYLADIQRNFFSSPNLSDRDRLAFTLAAYNVGPERVESLRTEAKRRGLNPDQWFFQVERVAMDTMGMGIVSYVNSVNKYFLAYSRERNALEPVKKKGNR